MSDANDLIRRDTVIAVLETLSRLAESVGMTGHLSFKEGAVQTISAIAAVQPDAAAIRKEALREAYRAVEINAWTHLGKDDYSQGMAAGARRQSEADCRAILALIDNTGKEVQSD
jgi:hypothetical protein